MSVNPIPKGFHTITPFFMSKEADKLIEFMIKALDAKTVYLLRSESGKVWHAQMQIGDSLLLVGDSMNDTSTAMSTYIYLADTDAAYKRAVAAGGESIMEPSDQFYGDRNAGIKDPFGNSWWFATHIEDVSNDEMSERARQFRQQGADA